ncbi:MAG: CHASE domain-containing protein [Polyangiales bacterium]
MSMKPAVSSRPEAKRRWWLAGVLALLYLVSARFSLLLAFPGTNASPIWPPSGVALAGLCLLGAWAWPAVAVAAFAANLASFAAGPLGTGTAALSMSLAIAAGNTMEAALGAHLARRYAAGGALDGVRDVGRFLAIALVTAVVSAACGTASLWIGGVAPTSAAGTVALTWWLGDLTGMLVVAPFMLSWLRFDLHRSAHDARWALRRACLLAVTLVLAWCTFSDALKGTPIERLSIYFAIPLLAASAFWFDGRTTTAVSLAWSVAAVWGTIGGRGPFATGPLNDALILLDTFLALCSATGLLLTTDRREERVRARQRAHIGDLAPSWLALLGCLALTVFAWHVVSTDTERRASERFAFQFTEIQRRIEERLLAYEQILWGCAGLMRASNHVSAAEWHDYVRAQQIDRRFPGLQGIGYAVVVQSRDKDAHEAALHNAGHESYAIRPAGAREVYTAIVYLEPFDWRNRRAFGYDMFSEPVRRRAMARARDTGRSAMSSRVTLVQETEREPQAGFLMYVPITRPGAAVMGTVDRDAALLGYVYSPFRMRDFMRGLLHDGVTRALSLEILDAEGEGSNGRLYASAEAPDRVDPHYRNPLRRSGAIDVAQHSWVLRAKSLPRFEQEIDRQKAQIVLFAGALLSLLFFVMVRTLSRTRARALELAGAMTTALRAAESRFTSLANAAREGILLLDSSGAITSCNPGASAMFDAPATGLHGSSWLTLVSEADRESAEAVFHALYDDAHDDGLAAPRSLVVTGQSLSGRSFPLEGSLCSWSAEGRRLYGLIVRDVSERKLAAEQLNASLALQISERRDREQEAQAALREKETLLKEVYHRVKNNLQVVSSLFNLQLRSLPDGPGRASLLEGAARVRAMALVHEKLYQSADLSSIQLGGYIKDLCDQLATAAAASTRGIRLVIEVEHVEAGPELAVPLGLLLNELVSNSFKHGFPDGRTGTLRVSLTRADDGLCWLAVGDDGVGFAEGATEPSSRSLGLRLVRTLSRQLHGDLTLDNDEHGGARASLSFRVDGMQATEERVLH